MKLHIETWRIPYLQRVLPCFVDSIELLKNKVNTHLQSEALVTGVKIGYLDKPFLLSTTAHIMAPFDKLFRRNSRQIDSPSQRLEASTTPAPNASQPPVQQPMGSSTPPQPNGMAPGANPASGPGPQPHNQQTYQNAGMLAGGALGAVDGDGVGGDMVGGMVVGGMVGQRVDQAQKHQYWRGQEMEYRAALAAGQKPVSAMESEGGSPSWWSREGREKRRLKRWEKRAERRDGTVVS
jgi:hypothetical protein